MHVLFSPWQNTITGEKVQRMKEQFMSAYDVTTDGRLQIQEVSLPSPSTGFLSQKEGELGPRADLGDMGDRAWVGRR